MLCSMNLASPRLSLLVIPMLLVGFLAMPFNLLAQDTLKINLQETEKLFLQKNLLLLAQQYNLNEAQALAIQAKAYPNPNFSAEINMVDPQNNRLFHAGPSGEKVFGIEQLIVMGGKRNTQIEIAKKNTQLAELELADLLRNLKWQLSNAFYDLFQQRFIIKNFDSQLLLLDTIIGSYEKQAAKGNIATKEVIRLKSVYLALNNSRSEQIQNQIESTQMLELLLHEKSPILPLLRTTDFQQFTKVKPLNELIELAQANRPDLKIANTTGEMANLNLKLQKQLATPDINLRSGYDQRGGAFNNQINIGLDIPLPIWNRNKGAIKAAEFGKKYTETLHQQKILEMESELAASQRNLERCIADFNKTNALYTSNFEQVFKGINDNFLKRNVSLIEFIDFFESYNQSLTEFQRVKTHLAKAAAQINFYTGSTIY